MSPPSSFYSTDSGNPPHPPPTLVRPERSDSLPQKYGQLPVMNLPNIMLSVAEAPTDNGESQQSQAESESAEQQRYAALMHSMDMMEGSYKYAGLGLTRRIPGSVARGRALAARRLRSSKTLPLSLRACYNETSSPPPPPPHDDNPPAPIGKWHCCKCNCSHQVYAYPPDNQHPISVLACECTHSSCAKCTLSGQLKAFVPMVEPEVVPLTEDGANTIRFGVVCDGCGVSLRAEKVDGSSSNSSTTLTAKEAVKSALLLALPKRLRRSEPQHALPLRNLRASRSMDSLLAASHATLLPSHGVPKTSISALNLRALALSMQKAHGAQAALVAVRFSGRPCTNCGLQTHNAASLCFQIVDPPRDLYHVRFAALMAERRVDGDVGFGSLERDKERGHGEESVVLMGGRVVHPNPVRCHPVG